MNTARVTVVGVFVGGASSRMGGRPKGLLLAPDGATVVARTLGIARGIARDVVLVGRADAYVGCGAVAIADAAGEGGPIAGLVALLERAEGGSAVAIACDMPYVTVGMAERLATFAPHAPAVAPRMDGRWSPFFARFDARAALDLARAAQASGKGPRAVLDALDARELPLDDDERRALRDWDAPEDMDA